MMSPARTGGSRGHYELNRVFPDVGEIRQTSGTSDLKEYHRRNAILTKLYETSQLDLLRAFKARRITIQQLVEHDRHGRVGDSLEMVEARRPLWATVEATLPLMGRTVGTRARYALSFAQLRERGGLGESATVADLRRVPWRTLRAAWPGSAADWNRLYSAVSRFLTLATGDKFSPFRRAVVKEIPRAKEVEAPQPDLTPAEFLRVLERIEDDAVRAAVMVLALTGMRVGEYLGLDRSALQPNYHRVRIGTGEGNKTGGRVLVIAPEDWGWVLAAVPFAGAPVPSPRCAVGSDVRYYRIRMAWRRACEAEGVPVVTLHALRDVFGQWASDAGISTGAIRDVFGHASDRMTRRYEKQAASASAIGAVGKVLRLAGGK